MFRISRSTCKNALVQTKCADGTVIYLSRRSKNRLIENAALKFKRNLKLIEEKAVKLKDINLDPPTAKVKEGISQSIQLIEGKDVIRKKKEILNKVYLESISEIISLHDNYKQLPKLNINSVSGFVRLFNFLN